MFSYQFIFSSNLYSAFHSNILFFCGPPSILLPLVCLSIVDNYFIIFLSIIRTHLEIRKLMPLNRLSLWLFLLFCQRDCGDPEEAFKNWLQKKQEQQFKDKQVEEMKRLEKESGFCLHSREESEKAFRQWVQHHIVLLKSENRGRIVFKTNVQAFPSCSFGQ